MKVSVKVNKNLVGEIKILNKLVTGQQVNQLEDAIKTFQFFLLKNTFIL